MKLKILVCIWKVIWHRFLDMSSCDKINLTNPDNMISDVTSFCYMVM